MDIRNIDWPQMYRFLQVIPVSVLRAQFYEILGVNPEKSPMLRLLMLHALFDLRRQFSKPADRRAYIYGVIKWGRIMVANKHLSLDNIRHEIQENEFCIIALGYRDEKTFIKYLSNEYPEQLVLSRDENGTVEAFRSRFEDEEETNIAKNERPSAATLSNGCNRILKALLNQIQGYHSICYPAAIGDPFTFLGFTIYGQRCHVCGENMSHIGKPEIFNYVFSKSVIPAHDKSEIDYGEICLLCKICIKECQRRRLTPREIKRDQQSFWLTKTRYSE